MQQIIIDAHTHAAGVDFYNLFIPRKPLVQSTRDLILKMDLYGIDYSIVMPMPFAMYYDPRKVSQGEWALSGLEEFPYQVLNTTLLYESQEYSDRLFPFMAIDPRTKVEEQIQFLTQQVERKKIYGLKLHTLATNSSATVLSDSLFAKFMKKYNLPIIIHAGRDTTTSPIHVLNFAKQNPEIRVCIAHLAGFDNSVLKQSLEIKNVFFDTSPFLSHCKFAVDDISSYVSSDRFNTNYDDPVNALLELSTYLKSKLLWGSDEPWTSVSNPKGAALSSFSYKDECSILNQLNSMNHENTVNEIAYTNSLRFLYGDASLRLTKKANKHHKNDH